MKLKTVLIHCFFLTIASFAFGQGENFSLIVESPASIAGTYDLSSTGDFGAPDCASEIAGELASGSAGSDTEACNNSRAIGLDVDGRIALVDRGNCSFIEKALVAQDFGAIAIIICNNEPSDSLLFLGASDEDLAEFNIVIPTFFMRQADCSVLKGEIFNNVTVRTERLDIGFFDINANDEVLWSEDFTGGLNGWTPEGILCGEGASPDGALWEWRDGGVLSNGLFSSPLAEMVSTTPCDGFIVFDSDFLDSRGEALGAGVCPVFQEGIITSPEIDLAAFGGGNGAIGIKFSQTGRPFDAFFVVEWSTDGGQTWDEREINDEQEVNILFGGIQRFPLSGVTGNDNLLIRFRFVRDYYAWGIDDVQIIRFEGVNAQIENTFYPPLSFAFPITHADADTFSFATDVINIGAEPIDVQLNVDVSKLLGGGGRNLVYQDSTIESGIGPGDTSNIIIPRLWVPNEIDTGSYVMDYNLSVLNDEDQDLTDNSESFFFVVSENLYAKALGIDRTAFQYRGADEEWGIAAQFPTANGVGNFKAEAIQFGVFIPEQATLQNFIAEVGLLKMVNTSPGFFPADFDRNNASLFNHPNLEIVFADTHVFSEVGNEGGTAEFVTIDLTDRGIDDLEPGTRYFVAIFFDDNVTSEVGIANQNLALIADDAVQMSGTYVYLPERAPSWFTGISGITPAPEVVLQIGLTSPVDEVPLPEQTFKAYPNPASDFITAELSFDEPTNVSIIIANIEGRILKVQEEQRVTNRSIPLDVKSMPNGSYLIRVMTNEGTKTRQVIVQH